MRLALVLCLVSGVALADTVVTKDGVTHVGRILDKTDGGYLFRSDAGETSVILYEDVTDVRKGDERPADVPVVQSAPNLTPTGVALIQRIATARAERAEISVVAPGILLGLGGLLTVGSIILYANNTRDNTALVGLAVGATMAAVSSLVLGLRLHHRDKLTQELRELEREAMMFGLPLPPP